MMLLRAAGMAVTMVMLVTSVAFGQAAVTGTRASVASAHRLLDVPYLPQTAELCGGAAAAMVMRYWGDRTALPVDFRSLVSSPAGIVTADLARAMTARGWLVTTRAANAAAPIDDLQRDVDQGRPVITLIEDSPGKLHYVVVVGVTNDQRVVLHDPARTSFRVVGADSFDAAWRVTGRWRMLVLPPAGRTAAPAVAPSGATTPSARTGACGAMVDHAVAIADTDAPSAERVLRAAIELCPTTTADPWLELAGLRFRAKAWREASDLATTSLAANPDDPDAWALLATARFLDDDAEGALAAWNQIGQPSIDTVTFTGATRTPQPALVRLTGLEPRTLLTASAFARAARAFADAPTAENTRLAFTPLGDGRASVTGSMVERQEFPSQPFALAAIGIRAIAVNDVRVMTAGMFGQGETLVMDWRWPTERPRLGAILNLPAPAPLGGIVTIDGFWERQSYAIPGPDGTSTVADPRRRLTFNLGNWWTSSTKLDVSASLDRLGADDYLAVHGAVEQHAFRDRLVGRLDAEIWRLGGVGFSSRKATLTVTSTTDLSRPSLTTLVGYASASAAAPRAIWMGAGTGDPRPVLLRAHPLMDEDVVDGVVFGQQLAFSTTEYSRPLTTRLFGALSAAVFVDAAQAWHTIGGGSSPFEVDAGAGFRLHVPSSGVARIDIAHGLRDGGTVLSVGWTMSAARLFTRGLPW